LHLAHTLAWARRFTLLMSRQDRKYSRVLGRQRWQNKRLLLFQVL
jgi:hypothetical protein